MAPIDPARKAPHIVIDIPPDEVAAARRDKRRAVSSEQDPAAVWEKKPTLVADASKGTAASDDDITTDTPMADVHTAIAQQALGPLSDAHIRRIHRLVHNEPAFDTLKELVSMAAQDSDAEPDPVALKSATKTLLHRIPALKNLAAPSLSVKGEPPPPDHQSLQSNVVGLVVAAMLDAFKSGNEDKRLALIKTEMYNQMLETLNRYVSDVLMKAQRRIAFAGRHINKSKQKNQRLEQASAVIDGILDDFNTEYAPRDAKKQAFLPQTGYHPVHGGSRQLTQADLQVHIDQANQWRQSIMNNQQKQSTLFQGVDSTQTSFLNGLGSLLKGAHDTAMALARNLHS